MSASKKPAPFVLAMVIILTAIFLFDVMGAIIKHLGQHYPAQQLSLFRNLFGLIPTVLILFWSTSWIEAGRPIVIKRWKLGLARGVLITLAQLSYYLALIQMEFATVSSIAFAGPLFITALSFPVLGHRVGLWRWLAVIIGFVGILLVVRPTSTGFDWIAILPLCAAVAYATNSVTARLFGDDVSTALINLYSNVGALTGSIVLVSFTGGYVPIASLGDWFWLVAMGTAGGVAVFCLISAYRMAEPSSLSPFEYFGIPFSFVLGWIFFAEAPFDRLFPGVLLIVGGGLVIVWREHAKKNDGNA